MYCSVYFKLLKTRPNSQLLLYYNQKHIYNVYNLNYFKYLRYKEVKEHTQNWSKKKLTYMSAPQVLTTTTSNDDKKQSMGDDSPPNLLLSRGLRAPKPSINKTSPYHFPLPHFFTLIRKSSHPSSLTFKPHATLTRSSNLCPEEEKNPS